MTTTMRVSRAAVAATSVGVLLLGCAGSSGSSPALASSHSTRASASTPASSASASSSSAVAAARRHPPRPDVGAVMARHVSVPWGIAFLPNGNALVSGRDSAKVLRVKANGGKKLIGRVSGVVSNGRSGGEAGLLGLAVGHGYATTHWVYAYLSTGSDNRVVRMRYRHGHLGKKHVVVKGIPRGLHHNGGRIAFGPDGLLYVTTGEGGVASRAQKKASLGGKILRLTPSGKAPAGNPFPKHPLVYSWGHRNVEGLAWDSAGRLWATEFGDKGWDELNLIKPGKNYGWPATEGRTSNPKYTSPKAQWHTFNAGPSGIAIVDDVAWIGGLTGHRLWRVRLDGGSVVGKKAFFTDTYGRIRTVVATPDGRLWMTTSNTDGRATPARHDDRILRVALG